MVKNRTENFIQSVIDAGILHNLVPLMLHESNAVKLNNNFLILFM